jgi:hypothetical protein
LRSNTVRPGTEGAQNGPQVIALLANFPVQFQTLLKHDILDLEIPSIGKTTTFLKKITPTDDE